MVKRISLTVDERVILHLMDYSPYEEDFESPEGTTQAGIANGIGIARKHVPRAVNKLMEDAMISCRVSHVKGAKQRKKVYFLTFEGKALGRRIWESIAKQEVVIRDDEGKDTHTTFSELCFTYQVGKSPVQIISQLREGNVFYPHRMAQECPPEDDECIDDAFEGAHRIYRKALYRAWEDNVLTKDEAAILEELRSSLRITDDDHRRMQEEILDSKEGDDDGINRVRIFSEVLDVALSDGKITLDEQNMLDELQRLLGIDRQVARKISEERSGEGEGMTEDRKEEIFQDIYSSVLKETLKDGNISRDEQNIIILLKKLLAIGESEHLELLDRARK